MVGNPYLRDEAILAAVVARGNHQAVTVSDKHQIGEQMSMSEQVLGALSARG